MKRTSTASPRYLDLQVRLIQVGLIAVCALALSTLLVYTYGSFTVPNFGYMGYIWNPNPVAMTTGALLSVATAVFLPFRHVQPSDLAMHVLFGKVYIPVLMLPSAYSRLDTADLIGFQVALAFGFLLICAFGNIPTIKMPFRIFSQRGYELALFGLAGIMLIPLLFYLGVPASLPTFQNVYEVRLNSRVSFTEAPFYVGYLYSWLAKAITPLMVGYGIVARRPLSIGAAVLITLYLYGLTGGKGLLFTIALVVAGLLVLQVMGRSLISFVLPVVVGIIAGGKLLDVFFTGGAITALIVNRAFIVPGVLTGFYQEFFTTNEHTYWAHSFLSWASTYQYDRTPPYLIGLEYFNNPATNATAPMWADGFANFGLAGVILVSIVAGLVIWFLNSVGQGRWWSLTAVVAVTIVLNFSGTALTTGLLSNGVALSLLLLFLLPSESSKPEETSPQ